MNKVFSDYAWEDYLYWFKKDRKITLKINAIIKDIDPTGYQGIGKPEPLRHELSGYWSRRVTEKDRFIYKIDDNTIYIIGCKGHYG